MKKFSKLLAVVLAIAVVICPMMSVVANADGTNSGTYSWAGSNGQDLVLTINSVEGFLVYKADIEFTNGSIDTDYDEDGYVEGVKLVDYTLVSEEKDNSYNLPVPSCNVKDNVLTVLVSSTDETCLDLYASVKIGIRVSDGTKAALTAIQAADDGDGIDPSDDPTLVPFPAADPETGVIDTEDEDYDEEAAKVETHTHTMSESYPATASTCQTQGNDAYYVCDCGKFFSDEECTVEIEQDSWLRVLDPANHEGEALNTKNYVQTEATCTGDAVYYQECSACGAQLATTWIDEDTKLGHNWGEFEPNGDATCTEDGTKTRTCQRAGCEAEDTVTAVDTKLGHDYQYAHVADSNPSQHTVTCSRCDLDETENCVDGEDEGNLCDKCEFDLTPAHEHDWTVVSATPATSTSDGSIKFSCSCNEEKTEKVSFHDDYRARKFNLNMAAETQLNYYVLDSEIKTAQDVFFKTVMKINDNEEEDMINYTTWDEAEDINFGGVDCQRVPTGVASKFMTNPVEFYEFVKVGDAWYSGRQTALSIVSAATNLYSGISDAERRLYADLLDYGGKAQLYFNYRTDNLANSDANLGNYKSYVTTTEPELTNGVVNEKTTPCVRTRQFALDLNTKVGIVLTLGLEEAPAGTTIDQVTAEISYERAGKTETVVFDTFEKVNDSRYKFYFYDLNSREFRNSFTVKYKVNGVEQTSTLSGSYEDFAAFQFSSVNDAEKTMYKAMVKYSDSSKAFFE